MKNFLIAADRIYAIPGWLLTRLILKGFINHPLKNRRLTLSDWTRNRTNDMRGFDLCFWVFLIAVPYAIYLLVKG
jgi:hypothetical protein